MSRLADLMMAMTVGGTVLTVSMLVCLSLPQSRLRDFLAPLIHRVAALVHSRTGDRDEL